MYPFLCLGIFCLLRLAVTLVEDSPVGCIPRRSVPFDGGNAHLFREKGVFNYSTMLLREDLNLLVVGAREVIYALDLRDISKKHASVRWEVMQKGKKYCESTREDAETKCKNYIRILRKMDDNKMYVCGTNAFYPVCDYLSYTNGQLTLEKKDEDGRGKCPFDPFQRYASIMFENSLYSATFANYIGLVPVLMRNFPDTIRTEDFWLNDPTFISMTVMPESEMSVEGDDDKIYLFFSEKTVENDYYKEVTVSRVARVCKGDLGGQKILRRRWTSFLKARMDCPVLESPLPNIIQDTYHWCDPQQRWKDCLLYAIFTTQSAISDLSAVCVYSFSNIGRVFAEGKYMTPVLVDTTFVKWDKYSGDVPVPRPGACIDNKARKASISTSLDLPDSTLKFVRLRPLMDQVILPIGEKPLLVRRGATFTRIIVNQVQAADGEKHHVMFIGTEEGTLVKAVNYDGEMFIIEEVELFQTRVPIKILKFSNVTGQLYAGSDHGAAQVPLATCGRSLTCMDCVLTRDPYCGWDKAAGKCSLLTGSQSDQIQSVKDGDASLCPDANPVERLNRSIWPGEDLKLHCSLPSNLAETVWELDGTVLTPTGHFQFFPDGLLIVNALYSDIGQYRCMFVERSKAGTYTTTVAEYQVTIGPGGCKVEEPIRLKAQENDPSVVILSVVIGVLSVFLLVLLTWNGYRGNIPLPFNRRKKSIELKEVKVNLEHCGVYYKVSAQTEKSILESTDNFKASAQKEKSVLESTDNYTEEGILEFTDNIKAPARTKESVLESTDNYKAPAGTKETSWSRQTTIKHLLGRS